MRFVYSRHTYTQAWLDSGGRQFLDDREPFGYRALADNTTHVVKEGESIFTIAGHHFRPHPRPAGLWWIIADFQPNPVHDPTLQLAPGSVLVLPSLQTVKMLIFTDARLVES